MDKYRFPNLKDIEVIFNGRRYKAFMVSGSSLSNGYEHDADFVIWDGLYDAAVAYGKISAEGLHTGFLAFSHVEIEVDSSSCIREFVANTIKAQKRFFQETGA